MLGELYYPTGKAKETAQQVLEIENPMACNVAWGCPNMCSYCFVPYVKKGEVRFPKRDPRELVEMQLKSGMHPGGVFLCFHTDPFVHCNNFRSVGLIDLLMGKKIRIATLSKVDAPVSFNYKDMRIGMTIVSDSDDFSKKFEPNALPCAWRIAYLKRCHDWGYYTWVSLEPFPTPNIFKQNLTDLLEKISFVDFIIFGKWNYNKRADDREFYGLMVYMFEKYCEQQGIRHFVKSGTRKFIDKRDVMSYD